MNQEFLNELKASGYVHTPLPLHFERSFEATLEDKEILKRRVLWHDGEESAFTYTGPGEMFLAEGKKEISTLKSSKTENILIQKVKSILKFLKLC